MAESILCYGIKSQFESVQVEKIDANYLDMFGYDFQVAFETIYNNGGNGSIDLLLFKDGQKVNYLEIEGWKIQKFHISWNWSGTLFEADVEDPLGDTRQFELSGDNGPMSPYKLTYEELLRRGFNEMNRICSFGSITMIKLCEHSSINMYPSSFSSYNRMLKLMSEFCLKVEEIRNRLHNNPDDKDMTAFNNVLKPKLIEYMEKLSNIKLSHETLDPNN